MDKEEIERRVDLALDSREFKDAEFQLSNFLQDCRLFVLKGRNDEYDEVSATRKNIEKSPAKLRTRYKSVYREIRDILLSLDIPEKLLGFRLLSDCILICAQGGECEKVKMSDVLDKCGNDFGISRCNAERLCRYALSFAKFSEKSIEKYPFLKRLSCPPTLKSAVLCTSEFIAENYELTQTNTKKLSLVP